nr:hypothetical protein [Acidobacteriota bacterium]
MILVGLLLLIGSSWTIGAAALHSIPLGWLRTWECAALRLTAGLGLTALALTLLTLAGGFASATSLLVALAIPGALHATNALRDWEWRNTAYHLRTGADALLPLSFAAIALACLGAIAPVTGGDALSYVIPEAMRIAETGRLDVWPDLARMMWPLSQQVLLASLIAIAGHTHLGVLTALQL